MLSPSEAQKWLENVVGQKIQPYFFAIMEQQKLLLPSYDARGRMAYDIRRLDSAVSSLYEHAELLQELEHPTLYTSTEAAIYLGTLLQKEIPLHVLRMYRQKQLLAPALVISRGKRRSYVYKREDLETMAMMLQKEEAQQPEIQGLLRTQEAITYLEQRLSMKIAPPRFYQYIHRHPESVSPVRVHHRYYFAPENLNKIHFGTPRQYRPHDFYPVKIDSSNDLHELERLYGCELVTKERLLEIIRARVGYPYKSSALKQRMAKRQIWPVAYDNSGARWYPVAQLDNIAFQHAPALRYKKKRS